MREHKYPVLLILKGKHGNHYFHLTGKDDLKKALARVFEINESNKYYYFEDNLEEQIAEKEKQIQILSTINAGAVPSLATYLKEQVEALSRDIRNIRNEIIDKTLYEKAKGGDSDATAKFVWDRQFNEYEELCFETYEKI